MSFIREMFLITVAVLAAWLASFSLKQLIGGLRPFEVYETLEPLFIYGGGDTFPSGHATIFSAMALMLVLLHRKAGVVFVILAVMISLGRVISGIHYPIDVFAGWIIGGIVSYIVFQLLKKKYHRE
jgi:undecaprenyl-diphosphatase